MTTHDRRLSLLAIGLVAALAFAIPVLGADPSPSASPSGEVEADDPEAKAEAAAEKAEAKAEAKANKGPEIALTLTGTVARTTDGKGRPTFTLTVGAVTWELSAGPKWYWGDKNPLAAFVGTSVVVTGTHHEGESELDVDTVNGKALRAAGKPPWAGGPKVVGKIHPGWKDWKANGKPGKGHGRAGAPGQTKDDSTAS